MIPRKATVMHAHRSHTTSSHARAFTIVELLVVIGVIGILALLTTLGARRLTAGSRLAAATNAVTSTLGNARAAAIKDSAVTGVVFRPIYNAATPQIPQRVEMITIRSTGERSVFGTTSIGARMAERYRPVQGIPATVLPEGITERIAKPVRVPELLARLHALLAVFEASPEAAIALPGYAFHPAAKLLEGSDGTRIRLTEKEAAILLYLHRAGGRAVPRAELLGEVWGYSSALWVGLIFAALIIPVFYYRHYIQDGGRFPKEAMEDLGLKDDGYLGERKAGFLPYLTLLAGAAIVLWANWFFVLPG